MLMDNNGLMSWLIASSMMVDGGIWWLRNWLMPGHTNHQQGLRIAVDKKFNYQSQGFIVTVDDGSWLLITLRTLAVITIVSNDAWPWIIEILVETIVNRRYKRTREVDNYDQWWLTMVNKRVDHGGIEHERSTVLLNSSTEKSSEMMFCNSR